MSNYQLLQLLCLFGIIIVVEWLVLTILFHLRLVKSLWFVAFGNIASAISCLLAAYTFAYIIGQSLIFFKIITPPPPGVPANIGKTELFFESVVISIVMYFTAVFTKVFFIIPLHDYLENQDEKWKHSFRASIIMNAVSYTLVVAGFLLIGPWTK